MYAILLDKLENVSRRSFSDKEKILKTWLFDCFN